MKINYCSAPCGSGKTRQIVQRALALVQRIREGANSTTHAEVDREDGNEEIQSFPNPPRVEVFHKGTVGKNIAKALADYVKDVPDEIQGIVIATHAVLPYIKHFENKYKWHVFVDEAMQVVRYQQHQIPRNHHLITAHLEVTPVNGIYGGVSVVDDEALNNLGYAASCKSDSSSHTGRLAELTRRQIARSISRNREALRLPFHPKKAQTQVYLDHCSRPLIEVGSISKLVLTRS